MITAFQWCATEGVLCEEPIRGIRYNIVDVAGMSDAIHRGGGQIIPATRRVLFASQLTAGPRLVEPIYLVELTCSESHFDLISKEFKKREIIILSSSQFTQAIPERTLRLHLPIRCSIGFYQQIAKMTQGEVQPICFFDQWRMVEGDPLDPLFSCRGSCERDKEKERSFIGDSSSQSISR